MTSERKIDVRFTGYTTGCGSLALCLKYMHGMLELMSLLGNNSRVVKATAETDLAVQYIIVPQQNVLDFNLLVGVVYDQLQVASQYISNKIRIQYKLV